MLSDFALAILALVFIFALGCIMVERRNDTSGAVKSKRKPRKRKWKTRRHYDETWWEPKKILTEKVITCIEEYLGNTFSCRYAVNSKVLWLSIYIYFLLKECTDFYVVRGIILIVVLKNVSKNWSVKKNKGERGTWDLCTQQRECLLDYSWFLRLREQSKKEKQKEEQLKPVFLSEPRSILFFFQDHVPGIMLREFKVVIHVFWNDHYQGARRTPTRNFISWISFSFVKCEPCMT